MSVSGLFRLSGKEGPADHRLQVNYSGFCTAYYWECPAYGMLPHELLTAMEPIAKVCADTHQHTYMCTQVRTCARTHARTHALIHAPTHPQTHRQRKAQDGIRPAATLLTACLSACLPMLRQHASLTRLLAWTHTSAPGKDARAAR